MERTFIAIKPDGVQRGVIGKIISDFEKKGFKLVGLKLMQVSKELAELHYQEHKSRPFFKSLVDFITSSPIVAMVIEGKDVINSARKILGKTNPSEADIGTIRGKYGIDIGRNIVHGSDGPESAKREICIFFTQDELVNWNKDIDKWIYE